MFLDIFEFTVENKKMFRENCFENEVSNLTKNSLYVHKTILEKMQKMKKVKTKNHENVLNLWRILGTKLVLLVNFWDHIFKTVFPKKNLFSTQNSKMSWNMCKLRHKVRNCQNLPHKSLNFTNYFFKSNFTYNLGHVSPNLRPNYQKKNSK